MSRRIFIGIFLVFASLVPLSSFAQEKSWHFNEWQTDITIHSDGSIMVEETTDVEFIGSFSWVARQIAKQGRMEVSDVQVYDNKYDEDVSLTSTVIDLYSETEVKIYHDTKDDTRNWTISYIADNVITNFDDYDELYWNAVSDDRDVPIDHVVAYIHLPLAVDTDAIQQRILSGSYGSKDELATFEIVDGKTLKYEGWDIAAYENFTIVAGFPKGLVPDVPRVSLETEDSGFYATLRQVGAVTQEQVYVPSTLYVDEDIVAGEYNLEVSKFGYDPITINFQTPVSGNVVVHLDLRMQWWYGLLILCFMLIIGMYFLSPIILFIILFLRWHRHGRDPFGKKVIIPQYEPFKDITPGVMGTLLDEKADLEDITSTLIDLAVRGYIKIHEEGKKKYRFTLLKKAYKEDKQLKEYERKFLEAIFSGDKTDVSLASLKYKFSKEIPALRKSIYKETVDAGLFEKDPDKVRKNYRIIGTVLLIIGFSSGFIYFIGLPIIVYGLIFFIFSKAMPKRTQTGVEAVEWSKGFKMYLYHAERYRLERMTIEFFERMLPYAMVFGVEKEWAKQFAEMYTAAPDWYASNNFSAGQTFNLVSFTSGLSSTMMPAVTTTLTAVRSSSSGYSGSSSFGSASSGSSGFSGGGFSGGGFGGGGSSAG
ncbi:MAG: DUF2207 domain-containing protein [bacterium]|nr:DUF2207 domain-containing protein [bacterium]